MSATWMRAQELGQPLTLTVSGRLNRGRRPSSSPTRSLARPLVSTIASLQNSRPVQAIVPRRNDDGVGFEPEGLEAVDEGVDLVGGHVEDEQLLLDGETHPVAARGLGQVGDRGERRAGDATDDRRGADVEAAVHSGGGRRRGRGDRWAAREEAGRR